MFIIGETYRRRTMHDQYGGQEQGGISTPASQPVVWLFSGDTGEQYGYNDAWVDENTFRYYGEGQHGDMKFVRGNRAIRDHVKNAEQLHLFQRLGGGQVRFLGEMRLQKYDIKQGKDLNNQMRDVIVFTLNRFESRIA